jgi:hyaluronate lyase
MGGYVFLRPLNKDQEDGNHVYIRKTVGQTNDTIAFNGYNKPTPEFLEIIMEHRPTDSDTVTNGRYYYAYLPNATQEATANYDDVELLAYNTDTHAVIEKNLGIIACNFFTNSNREVENPFTDSSAVTKIKTNRACSVMVTKNTDGSYTVSVSDPTQLSSSIKLDVAISGISQVVSADNGISATVENGVAKITANTNGSMGATFSITLK